MRQKTVVMGTISPAERREVARKACIAKHEPYTVYRQSKDLGFKSKGYCIVYEDPFDTHRTSVMSDIPDKKTAQDLKYFCEQAWAEGYIAGSRE